MKTSLLAVLVLSAIVSQKSFAITASEFSGQGDSFPLPCEIKCAEIETRMEAMPGWFYIYITSTQTWDTYYIAGSTNVPSEIKLGSHVNISTTEQKTINVEKDTSELPEELKKLMMPKNEVYKWANAVEYKRQGCSVLGYSLNNNRIQSEILDRFHDPAIVLELKKVQIIDQYNKSLSVNVATRAVFPYPTAKTDAKARLVELRKIGLCSLERP
jgi:hypothetical protein